MIPRLEKVDAIIADQVNDAVLLCQAAGPHAGGKVLQRFRLADAGKGVTQDCLDDVRTRKAIRRSVSTQ